MFKIFAFFAFGVAACAADAPVVPPVLCGEIPDRMFSCLGKPKVLGSGAGTRECIDHKSECDRLKCTFDKSGWLDGDKVNNQKLLDHFDQFSKDHPDWTEAVEQVKTRCLSGTLPPQGVYLNCPAYDVMNCIIASFIKNARPSHWSSIPQCKYPREFAAACPVCPTDCFAPQVPYGSCNACVLLPRSP